MLSAKDYKDALDVQNACNLSGVVLSFSNMTDKIWKEARELNKGTEYVNNHPITKLYVDKLHSLCGNWDGDSINESFGICEKKAKEQ
jgi:hypothetical protein